VVPAMSASIAARSAAMSAGVPDLSIVVMRTFSLGSGSNG
jgi:hypothetical protein